MQVKWPTWDWTANFFKVCMHPFDGWFFSQNKNCWLSTTVRHNQKGDPTSVRVGYFSFLSLQLLQWEWFSQAKFLKTFEVLNEQQKIIAADKYSYMKSNTTFTDNCSRYEYNKGRSFIYSRLQLFIFIGAWRTILIARYSL